MARLAVPSVMDPWLFAADSRYFGTSPASQASMDGCGPEVESSETPSAAPKQTLMFDIGSGPPVLVLPGIQGRWEWIEPALRALSARCRTLSVSLPGESGSGMQVVDGDDFAVFSRQIDGVLDSLALESVAVCGVSFGGLVAVHYAATRPSRVRSLVLVSVPGPRWEPSAHQMRFLNAPRLAAPVFLASARGRLYPEVRSALPAIRDRVRFAAGHGLRVLRAPFSAARMSERLRLARLVDFEALAREILAPTLVVTGEAHLDRVVPEAGTRDYVGIIRGARHVTFEKTGHIGLVTRPHAFAQIVSSFVEAHVGDAIVNQHPMSAQAWEPR
jgi:pimeloyl-ACP methyl ester carboxylesterase